MMRNWSCRLTMFTLLVFPAATCAFGHPPKEANSSAPRKDDSTPSLEAKGSHGTEQTVANNTELDRFMRFDFSKSAHDVFFKYRMAEQHAAADEIDKAVAWLKEASNFADSTTRGDLLTAETDLTDIAGQLRSDECVYAWRLEEAFGNASKALSKHHRFLAAKATARNDMKLAAKELLRAIDHLRDAAHAANHEYNEEIVNFYHHYCPHGYWDKSLVPAKNDIEVNLERIQIELEKIYFKTR